MLVINYFTNPRFMKCPMENTPCYANDIDFYKDCKNNFTLAYNKAFPFTLRCIRVNTPCNIKIEVEGGS